MKPLKTSGGAAALFPPDPFVTARPPLRSDGGGEPLLRLRDFGENPAHFSTVASERRLRATLIDPPIANLPEGVVLLCRQMSHRCSKWGKCLAIRALTRSRLRSQEKPIANSAAGDPGIYPSKSPVQVYPARRAGCQPKHKGHEPFRIRDLSRRSSLNRSK